MSNVGGPPARILHVDDDTEILNNVEDYLRGEEIAGWGRPDVIGVSVFDDALALLEEQRFDMVILDVRLGAHNQAEIAVREEAGVATLEQIQQRRFVPVVFWTGLPRLVEHLTGPLVKAHEKTAGLPVLRDSVRDLFATRLPTVNRALLRLVEEEQRRYMWSFVATHWDQLQVSTDHTALAYLLARRLGRALSGPGIERLAADLGESGGPFPPSAKIHPVEIYVQPPLADAALQVGDLLQGVAAGLEGWYLILTPSCDLEHGKAEHVVLAAAVPLEQQAEFVAWREATNRKGRERGEKKLAEIISHATGGQRDRWLFLPAAVEVPDLVVDFQRLLSVPCAEANSLRHVASLDSPFAEAAVNRFGRYLGRIGTPDLDSESVLRRLADEQGGRDGEPEAQG